MWGGKAIVVAVGLAVLGVVAPAAAGQRGAALQEARLKLPAAHQAVLAAHLDRMPAIARRLVRRAAPYLTVRASRSPGTSRAHQVPMAAGPVGARYVVELDRRALRPGERGRLVVLHELGHVVDWAFVDPDLRTRFDAAFAASTAARACFARRGRPCAPAAEVFADQFAFWAGGRRSLRSSYGVPPLLSRGAFDELIAAAGWSADSPLGVNRG